MVRKSRARSSSLFLIELILAILFFSVASAVCVQLFVKSHLLSTDSNALNHAVNECANVAEIVASAERAEDVLNALEALYPDASRPEAGTDTQDNLFNGTIFVFYDNAFVACKEGTEAEYFLAIHLTEEENTLQAHMQMSKMENPQDLARADGQIVFELETTHHVARRTDHAQR